jgi:hypothetical protein
MHMIQTDQQSQNHQTQQESHRHSLPSLVHGKHQRRNTRSFVAKYFSSDPTIPVTLGTSHVHLQSHQHVLTE